MCLLLINRTLFLHRVRYRLHNFSLITCVCTFTPHNDHSRQNMSNPKNSPHFPRSATLSVIVEDDDDDDEPEAEMPKSASFTDNHQAHRLPPKQFQVLQFVNETKSGIPLPDYKIKSLDASIPSSGPQPIQQVIFNSTYVEFNNKGTHFGQHHHPNQPIRPTIRLHPTVGASTSTLITSPSG